MERSSSTRTTVKFKKRNTKLTGKELRTTTERKTVFSKNIEQQVEWNLLISVYFLLHTVFQFNFVVMKNFIKPYQPEAISQIRIRYVSIDWTVEFWRKLTIYIFFELICRVLVHCKPKAYERNKSSHTEAHKRPELYWFGFSPIYQKEQIVHMDESSCFRHWYLAGSNLGSMILKWKPFFNLFKTYHNLFCKPCFLTDAA